MKQSRERTKSIARIKFSLRTVFLLVLLISLYLGYYLNQVRQQQETLKRLQDVGADFQYARPGSKAHEWLRKFVPKKYVASIVSIEFGPEDKLTDMHLEDLDHFSDLNWLLLKNTSISDGAMAHIEKLDNLIGLFLDGTRVSDNGLVHLKPLQQLMNLSLYDTSVGDAGLKRIEHLATIRYLNLGKTNVTDAGLIGLKKIKNLEALILDSTHVSDHGLQHLYGLRNLKYLNLSNTEVTTHGVKMLQKKLPATQILADRHRKR